MNLAPQQYPAQGAAPHTSHIPCIGGSTTYKSHTLCRGQHPQHMSHTLHVGQRNIISHWLLLGVFELGNPRAARTSLCGKNERHGKGSKGQALNSRSRHSKRLQRKSSAHVTIQGQTQQTYHMYLLRFHTHLRTYQAASIDGRLVTAKIRHNVEKEQTPRAVFTWYDATGEDKV